MSDTRTIYLKNNEGTIYSSDPSTKGYTYLDMSDFDNLNPSDNSIFTLTSNTSLLYSAYDVKLVLTFISDYDNGRQARAEWIAKNQNAINQISVANTNNPDLIFSKQAKIKTIDFVENPYVNGVQAELTLELAGRWQSSVKRTRAIVYPYTGGTKKYAYHYSTLGRSLLTNRNLLLGTKDFSGNSNWVLNSNTSKVNDIYQGLDTVQTAVAWGGPKYNNSALETQGAITSTNDTFIMSAWVRNTGTTPVSIYFYGDFVPNTSQNIAVLSANSGWVRINSAPFRFSKTSGLTGSIRFEPTTGATDGYVQQVGLKLEKGNIATDWTPAPEDTNPKPTYKYGYQIITDEVKTDGYNGFIINIPSQTTPVNVTLTAPNGLSATIKTSRTNVPLQISSDMIGYSLNNFDTFTLLNKGFPASKYWDNLLSVYSTIQTILNFNTVTVSVTSGTGTSIPFEFYLYKLQDLI